MNGLPVFRGGVLVLDEGDRVRDPLDGEWHTVRHRSGDEVVMTDGGVMSLQECIAAEKLLPSESA